MKQMLALLLIIKSRLRTELLGPGFFLPGSKFYNLMEGPFDA
jgi:hypothetical protein